MKPLLTRRRVCAALLVSPLLAQIPVGFARARQSELPTLDARTAELPAETLYAIGARLLREGRTFEKAAAHFLLASQKEPTNPKHQLAFGCALASRAAALARAARYTQELAKNQRDYSGSLKEWVEGRADWEQRKSANPQTYGYETWDDKKPVAPPTDYEFLIKDDKAPFRLTPREMAARLSDLSQKAQTAWEKGVALSKTPEEKAQSLYTQAWGLAVLRVGVMGFGEKGIFGLQPPSAEADDLGNDVPPPPKPLPHIPTAEAAIKAAEEATRLMPDSPLYARACADLLELDWSGPNHEKAFAAYEKAALLAPKDVSVLYLLYQKTVAKAIKDGEAAVTKAYMSGATQNANETQFATPMAYLRRAQARDKSNAWGLYEEAGILFRLAPYTLSGSGGAIHPTPEQTRGALNSVFNAPARKRGKRAVDLVVRGNGLPVYRRPHYQPSIPFLLTQAWVLCPLEEFAPSDTFDTFARLRDLARALGGYARVMAVHENKRAEGVRASRASLAMGFHQLPGWPELSSPRTEMEALEREVGVTVVIISYRTFVKFYQALSDADGEKAITEEYDNFRRWDAAYRKAHHQWRGDTISRY